MSSEEQRQLEQDRRNRHRMAAYQIKRTMIYRRLIRGEPIRTKHIPRDMREIAKVMVVFA